MSRHRYSYNLMGFGGEDVGFSLERVARLGYDAVEVEGEPERHDPRRIEALAGDLGLTISSVCPNFTSERDLSHPDPDVRREAIAYVRRVVEFAGRLGAPLVVVCPTAYLRTTPIADPLDEWRWAVESIHEAGEHAVEVGIDLSLECWNRYGTYMLNRVDEGVRMWQETGLRNGGVMADTFHMNIEERSVAEAVGFVGPLLNHVHLSDSNRLAPGLGHIDFGEVLGVLDGMGYEGYLAFELIADLPNRFDGGDLPDLDGVAEQAIGHMRTVERLAARMGGG